MAPQLVTKRFAVIVSFFPVGAIPSGASSVHSSFSTALPYVT